MSKEKVLGILGGMGPQATADFMIKIIRATKAGRDQENIRMLVDCNPKVPPRVEAILAGGQSAGPAMAEMAAGLERCGADMLVIACNTAHYYYLNVAEAVSIPVLNLIDLTVDFLKDQGVEEVLLLGTLALLQAGLYEVPLQAVGIRLRLPSTVALTDTLEAIRSVKAGKMDRAYRHAEKVARWCKEEGISQVILGCTELPIAFDGVKSAIRFYDPGEISAEAIVRKIKG